MKRLGRYGVLGIGALVLVALLAVYARPFIQGIAGLAVAQTSTLWNNVRDAAFGDAATNGVMMVSPVLYNGTTFDRVRGTIANGMQVDVTRVTGTVTVAGAATPADGFANPTNAVPTYSLTAGFNGTTWDRIRGSSARGLMIGQFTTAVTLADAFGNIPSIGTDFGGNVQVNLSYLYGFNGTTWDRLRLAGSGTGVLRVEADYSFSNITTNTTTTIKSGAGALHTLIINTRGTASTATIYDNTAGSGTKIGTVDTSLSTTAFVYDATFGTGLTVVTAGTGAADITATYR